MSTDDMTDSEEEFDVELDAAATPTGSSDVTWQKELRVCTKLPYYTELSAEANIQWAAIKAGLGLALQHREMRPGFIRWVCELDKYISMNGRRFSKQDHIALVELLYSVIFIENLELRMVKTCARVLSNLLSKRSLLTRDDITLDWKPLYKLFVFLEFKDVEDDGVMLFPADINTAVEALVKNCTPYFSIDATREILDEVRPYICPWDMSMLRAVMTVSYFIPTLVPPDEHARTIDLWFGEIMFWYTSLQNNPLWQNQLVALFSRLAHDQMGYIDWTPYLSDIFIRIFRSFRLRIGIRQEYMVDLSSVASDIKSFDCTSASIWLASLLHVPAVLDEFFPRLMAAFDSYYHPSNHGLWTEKLMTILYYLPYYVCVRLHRERHMKADWRPIPPAERRMTDEMVDRFVGIMLPRVQTAMFAKYKAEYATAAFRYLAQLCPKMVVDSVMDKVSSSLDTLIEPHRLVQSLSAMNAVLLQMVRRPECRHHAIPTMVALLPAIDMNDVSKCTITFQALSLFATMVPLVDCSEAVQLRDDLTAEEKELCSATANFEDFAVQLVERLLEIIEMCSQTHHRQTSKGHHTHSPEEMAFKSGISTSLRSLLSNCSSSIHEIVLNRCFRFLSETVLEGRVSADMTAEVCFSLVRTRPEPVLKRLMPFMLEKLRSIITAELYEEDEINDLTMWYLMSSVQLVRCDGKALLPYQKEIMEIIRLVIPITKSKEAYSQIAYMLEHLLGSLCNTYMLCPPEQRAKLDPDLTTHLPIRHWAEHCDFSKYSTAWHTPNEEELAFAQEILQTVLLPQLEALKNPKAMTNEKTLHSISVVRACVGGAGGAFPYFDTPIVPLTPESRLSSVHFSYISSAQPNSLKLCGRNARHMIYESLHDLLNYLLKEREDDTKSLSAVCQLLYLLVTHRGVYRRKFEIQKKGFTTAVRLLGDLIYGKRANIRALVNESVLVQHHRRTLERSGYSFTQTHLAVMRDLLRLSTSHYSQIRREGQTTLNTCIGAFPFSYKLVLDDVLGFLSSGDSVSHEQFKGALYILYGTKKQSLCSRASWPTLRKIWPAVIRAQHSEKPSIINLLDSIHNAVVDQLESFQITLEIPDSVIEMTKKLWSVTDSIGPSSPPLDAGTMAQEKALEKQRNLENKGAFDGLVEDLIALCNDSTLHWRHVDMANAFLTIMLRLDYTMPPNGVEVLVKMMVHDTLKTRKMGITALGALLKLQKRPAKKRVLTDLNGAKSPVKQWESSPPSQECVCPLLQSTETPCASRWGFRSDNTLCQYREAGKSMTADEYNKTAYYDKTHWGFYSWPKEMSVNDDLKLQPKLNRSAEEMLDVERPLFEALSRSSFVDQLVAFLTVEEDKDDNDFQAVDFAFFRTASSELSMLRVKLAPLRLAAGGPTSLTSLVARLIGSSMQSSTQAVPCTHLLTMFVKGICRNYGDGALEHFRPHMERLVSSDKRHEQRFLAEIAAGIIQGSKRWDYDTIERVWAWLKPVLEKAFSNITTESQKDWGTFIATCFDSRDPRKLHHIIDMLFEHAERPHESTFQAATRLYLLQGGLNQLEWRAIESWHRVLELCRGKMCQDYQNIRERLGSCLATAFWFELPGITVEAGELRPPCRTRFVDEACDQLECLYSEMLADAPVHSANGDGDVNAAKRGEDGAGDNGQLTERKRAILTLKTVLCYSAAHWQQAYTALPEVFIRRLLPLLVHFDNDLRDDELKRDAHWQLLFMAKSMLCPGSPVDRLIEQCEHIASKAWWKARVSMLYYLQISTFSNLFVISKEQAQRILDLILKLLADSQIEVQQAAAETLSGFIHCGFVQVSKHLMHQFLRLSAAKETRHAGVFGLSAIVNAAPYTIPAYLPDALMALMQHAQDPQPILGTVKKALSEFKRTHQDSWHEHKQAFTDDQLSALTGLLVSPNYYV